MPDPRNQTWFCSALNERKKITPSKELSKNFR